ncbi:adenylylsulfate 3-phosphotransferase [Trichinella spiralis]|uniref:adenylylsulfate 3-phosphotransferase n=1 Tax=Trichinella spiralis TaxID=6334 RepID=UPI0001EFD0AF|nr:adenylylsulfate 3-phosphotransferase [Trichinella spiralis]
MPSSVGPKTSVPVLYCLVSKLKDIPYESEIMDDNKRQGIWHSGFRKAVQYDSHHLCVIYVEKREHCKKLICI